MKLIAKYPTMQPNTRLIGDCLTDPWNIGFDGKPRHPKFSGAQYHVRTHVFDVGREATIAAKPWILRVNEDSDPKLWGSIRNYLDLQCSLSWANENGGHERYDDGICSTWRALERVSATITKALMEKHNHHFYDWQIRLALDYYLARATNNQVVTKAVRLEEIWKNA